MSSIGQLYWWTVSRVIFGCRAIAPASFTPYPPSIPTPPAGARVSHFCRPPRVDADPAVLREAEPAGDRGAHRGRAEHADPVAHGARLLQRRQRERRAEPAPARLRDGEDEVDASHARAEEERGRRDGLPIEPPQIVAPGHVVAEADAAVHLADPPGLARPLPEAPGERGDPVRQPGVAAHPLDP